MFVIATQGPDGLLSEVTLTATQPEPEEAVILDPSVTVWTAPDGSTENTRAMKVLDLAMSDVYRDENPDRWTEGSEKADAFHDDATDERAFLRIVEANLTLSGFTRAYTGCVQTQDYGVTMAGNDGTYYLVQMHRGWHFAHLDPHDFEGWSLGNPIAPLDASPRRVADALLVKLADVGEYDPAGLSPLRRCTFELRRWQAVPHWANLKFRGRRKLKGYRYRLRRLRALTRR